MEANVRTICDARTSSFPQVGSSCDHFCGITSIFGLSSYLSGIIIFIMGIIGLYIGKVFDNVKNRPTYIIRERLNLDPPSRQ